MPASTTVKVGLTQMACGEDPKKNLAKQLALLERALKQGAKIVCTQELFRSQYFCQSEEHRFFALAESIPGPSTDAFAKLARKYRAVIVASLFEKRAAGVYHNTAAVIDADGRYLGKYRKQHIPQTKGFWEKYYFTPGTDGYPVFETAVGKVGVYICYDRHFPEGWRALGLNGAEIVFNPSATSRGLSEYIWRIEQPASAVANMYYVGAINRVGIESEYGDDDFYGQSYFVDPEGKFVGEVGDPYKPELIVRDLDMDKIKTVRDRWAFYRDRRPDAYDELIRR